MRSLGLLLWSAAAVTALWLCHHTSAALARVVLRWRRRRRHRGFDVTPVDDPCTNEKVHRNCR
jgi:hypothetical protein